jgi:hypothetical protein
MKSLLLLIFTILPVWAAAQPKLVSQRIQLKDGRKFTLSLPADFEIVPAAEGLKRVRFFAKSPDDRIFVTDMYNLTDNKRGAVYILDGWDAKTGKLIPLLSQAAASADGVVRSSVSRDAATGDLPPTPAPPHLAKPRHPS